MLGILPCEALDQRMGEGLLGLEVIEEGALGDAGALDDPVDRGGGKAVIEDERLRRIHDRRARPPPVPGHGAPPSSDLGWNLGRPVCKGKFMPRERPIEKSPLTGQEHRHIETD